MANINIKDLSALNLTGAELFNDSESFMTELSDQSEQMAIQGGCGYTCGHTCGVTEVKKEALILEAF
ncbi:MAG: hypothetical protein F6K56_31810 [Moorea sp. SIO3G5]|nr:hypothetical protein [Moorena sp. SIO3G5]